MQKQGSHLFARSSGTPLTVAHVVEGCRGGVGSAVKHLIEAQSKDHTIGEVHLFADPGRMGDMLHDVPAFTHEYESTRDPLRLLHVSRLLMRQLRLLSPDVVYLHSTYPGLYGRLTLNKNGEQWTTIYCAHGWAFTQRIDFLRKKFYTLIERALAYRTDAIVSISYSEFDAAAAANVCPPLHRVIHHGVPARSGHPPALLAMDPNRLNLAFVGRFDRQKGLDLLLKVLADRQLSHITLWVIGDSTLGPKVSIPEQTNVHLLGWVPHQEIDSYMQCFDAVVVPSLWEGFGLIALEAMRNGKAVLASRTGGLAEQIIDGVNGRFFNTGDENDLRRLLLDISKPQLETMGKMAAEIFHMGFELATSYERWSEVTQEALTLRMNSRSPHRGVSYVDQVTVLPIEEI